MENNDIMPLICLRCKKYIPLTLQTFREIGYTKYSYCDDCLHEGIKLLRNKDQAEERKKTFYVIDTPMGIVQEYKGRPMAFRKRENAEKELQATEESMKRNGMAGWCGYMFVRPETLERSQKNKNEYLWMEEMESEGK